MIGPLAIDARSDALLSPILRTEAAGRSAKGALAAPLERGGAVLFGGHGPEPQTIVKIPCPSAIVTSVVRDLKACDACGALGYGEIKKGKEKEQNNRIIPPSSHNAIEVPLPNLPPYFFNIIYIILDSQNKLAAAVKNQIDPGALSGTL